MSRRKLLKQHIEHYCKWLRFFIRQQTKSSETTPDPLRLQRPSQGSSSGLLYLISPDKEHYRERKSKVSWILQSPVSSSQASAEMETSRRPKMAKHLLEGGENQNGNTRVHKASLTQGEWVSLINLSDAYLHIPIHPSSRKFLWFTHQAQIYQFTSLPFRLAIALQVFIMIVKEGRLMALSRVISRAERGDQNCGRIFVTYFPIFSGNLLYNFSVFQNLGKITDI